MQELKKRFPLFIKGPLAAYLLMDTKSVELTMKGPLLPESLPDLAEFFNWCEEHIEANSLLIKAFKSSNGPVEKISQGVCQNWTKTCSEKELTAYLKTVQELSIKLLHLPQTVIVDLGLGASNIACELFLCADVLIGHENTELHLNHTRLGLVPSSSGVGTLSARVSDARARSWFLTAKTIKAQELQEVGLLYQTYNETSQHVVVQKLLQDIGLQSPVARIQTKMAFTARLEEAIVWSLKNETQFASPSLALGEWSNLEENQNFTPARKMASLLRQKLNSTVTM